jgi:hypothetical protein
VRRLQHSLLFESYGLVAEVQSDDRELLDSVPIALPPGWRRPNGAPVSARFGLTGDGAVTVDGAEVSRTDGDRESVLVALGSAVRHHVALHAPAHVFIHAGVACAYGSAIVIPGSSFSGKTTLVAELVRAGATYYSDEYAVVDEGGMIHPYPKPLSIRFDPRYRGVPIEVSEADVGTKPINAGLIVLTSYQQGTAWRPVACTPGEGALGLLQHTVPARSRSGASLAAVRRLAQDAHVIAGARGEANLVGRSLLRLARSTERS